VTYTVRAVVDVCGNRTTAVPDVNVLSDEVPVATATAPVDGVKLPPDFSPDTVQVVTLNPLSVIVSLLIMCLNENVAVGEEFDAVAVAYSQSCSVVCAVVGVVT
jgi:hypothetical protein